MTVTRRIQLEFEARLITHPRAYHLRRMRMALWLYLVLLTRLPIGSDTFEVNPEEVARAMGIPEGTVRSWLGHLKRLRYLGLRRLNGSVHIRVTRLGLPEPTPAPKRQFFTVRKLERALGETGNAKRLEDTLAQPEAIIRRALAGTQAVPESRIRRSRTALFLYLVKRYAQEAKDSPRT